ncbi:DUF2795 domain-containing protein [Plantactinospora sp. GCM10030261]|uniref:DUF2795 domain-containing protein n=1 Tax=Plantactinospora sp. GCM10030261 TaxID=3273420 RepID=UPI00361E6668
MTTNEQVMRYLSAMDYPAGKDEILREAQRAGAPPEVLRALRAIPPVDYANTNEVVRSARTELAPEVDAGERAGKARDRRHQRVARDLRSI